MKHLIIIGARGFGREVYNTALESVGFGKDYDVKGFLDDKSDALDEYDGYPSILSSVEDYIPQNGDVFICALGDVSFKNKYVEMISAKGAEFISIIHKDATIEMNSKYGKGCIFSTGVRISCDVKIGNFVSFNDNAVIGHDVVIGDFCHLNSNSFMGGYSQLGNYTTVHTSAIITPHIIVGNHSVVGAGAVVTRRVKDGVTVYGNPAKIFSF